MTNLVGDIDKIEIVSAPWKNTIDIISNVEFMPDQEAFQEWISAFGTDKDSLYVMVSHPSVLKYKDDEHKYTFRIGRIITDLASIPRIPFIYAVFKLSQPVPSLYHDGAYVVGSDGDNSNCTWWVDGVPCDERMPEDHANKLYEVLLEYYGVSDIKATAEYAALQAAGHIAYDKHKATVDMTQDELDQLAANKKLWSPDR